MICNTALAYFCSIYFISAGPFGLYSTAGRKSVTAYKYFLFTKKFATMRKTFLLLLSPHFLAAFQYAAIFNISILCLAFSCGFEEMLGVFSYRLVHCLLIYYYYYYSLSDRKGNEEAFPSHIFCMYSKELPHALFLSAPGKEIFGLQAGAATGSTLCHFVCESKQRIWKKVGQGGKKFNSCQGDTMEFECTLAQAAKFFMAGLPALG